MDIPDIAIVVQWKATCRLTELWQRWGRAARAPGGSGVAILFADKNLFDDVREEKKSRQQVEEAKKRQREETSADLPPSKRANHNASAPSLSNATETGTDVPSGPSRPSPSESANNRAFRNTMFPSLLTVGMNSQPTVKKAKRELDPAMDCLINAEFRGTTPASRCRRKVIEIYFEGEGSSHGKFPIEACNFELISSEKSTISLRVTPLAQRVVCAVPPPSRLSAVISTVRPSSQIPSHLSLSSRSRTLVVLTSQSTKWRPRKSNFAMRWRSGG